ncbi:major DNA-binding protein [Striga asiatica]|uniref:Major DNA-binding protein n=1 Tax=Striga asiatica TaxID=4170 RepID=A0A5A7P324_STRAF|nr:major DNA-binding protein [Striga asiatica]
MKVTELGTYFSSHIRLKIERDSFPSPFTAWPTIIDVHETTSFIDIPLKMARAFVMLPHFAYMSIRAFPKTTLLLKHSLLSTMECAHFIEHFPGIPQVSTPCIHVHESCPDRNITVEPTNFCTSMDHPSERKVFASR